MPDQNGITLQEATDALVSAMTARTQLLSGAKSARVNAGGVERQVTREDLDKLNNDILFWEGRVRRLSNGGGIRARGVMFQC